MTIRLRLHVNGIDQTIGVCEDCPAFRDPDPYPCYCALDLSEDARGRRTVPAGGPVPYTCPLLTLRVHVLERSDSDAEDDT